MRRRPVCVTAAALLAVGALAAACAPPTATRRAGDRLTYRPPSGSPPPAGQAFVPAPPAFAVEHMAERLRRAGLEVNRVEPDAGLVVARYSGDPAPYVDCGWIEVTPDGGRGAPERVEAASPEARFVRRLDGEPAVFERRLRLDGRLVASVAPTARGSVVDAGANYVLTKSVDAVGPGGDVARRDRETASFSTGGSGGFEAGTVCRPTGRFEAMAADRLGAGAFAGANEAAEAPPALAAEVRRVLAAFACPDVEVDYGPGNAVLAYGYVPDRFSQRELQRQLELIPGIGPVETRLDVHGPEFCQALEIAALFRDPGAGAGDLRVRVAAPEDRGNLLETGEELVLDVVAPDRDTYVRFDLVGADGRVVHLGGGRAGELGAGDGGSFRYATGYEAGPPFGRALVLALATERPIFEQPLPEVEAARDYLPELRRRVEALAAEGGPAAADYAVLATRRPEES